MRVLRMTAGLLLMAGPAWAQGTCKPGDSSNEAEVFRDMSVPLAFSQGQAPWTFLPGAILAVAEVSDVPTIDDKTATPSKCRPGTGPDNWGQVSIAPRLRVGFSLSNAAMLELSWTPPIRISGVKPNLWSFALSRTVPIGKRGALMSGRLHATIGSLKAPITCSEEAVDDPTDPCYHGDVSDDKYKPAIYGGELTIGKDFAGGRLRPYAGGGYNLLRPRFEQDGKDSTGQKLDQKVEVNTGQWIVFGGLTWAISPVFHLSGEAYSAPADAFTWRARATYVFSATRKRHR
jgi:hypothetical protein